MLDLAEFTEIPLNERVRKLDLGQIILIDQDQAFKLYLTPRREQLKPRDPRLSRTLNPPYGQPMFVQDTELEKWLRRETQNQGRRTTTETSKASTSRETRSDS